MGSASLLAFGLLLSASTWYRAVGFRRSHHELLQSLNSQDAAPICPEDQAVCNVVLVIDMQNDYCSTCDEVEGNSTLQKSQSKWSGTTIKEISPAVQAVLTMREWDMVVLTKDMLKKGTGYLEMGSPGSNVVKEITDLVDRSYPDKTITFSKDTDDWMNTLAGDASGAHAFAQQRHFALEDEGKYVKHEAEYGGDYPTLKNILEYNGFHPGKTNLVVTGVLTNRCVLKGSVHAQMEGYSTFVVMDATGGSTDADRWEKSSHGAPELDDLKHRYLNDYHPNTTNTIGEIGSPEWDMSFKKALDDSDYSLQWQQRIYSGSVPKGGPSLEDTWEFLKLSGVLVADTARDFKTRFDFDLDRPPAVLLNELD